METRGTERLNNCCKGIILAISQAGIPTHTLWSIALAPKLCWAGPHPFTGLAGKPAHALSVIVARGWPGPPALAPAPCLHMVVATRARDFITMLYASLVPSHSSRGACHFDVVSASRPASGLHMEGWASGPSPLRVPSATSPERFMGPASSRFWIPAWGSACGGARQPGLRGSSREDAGSPGTEPALQGKEQGQRSAGLPQKAASWQKALL